MSSSSGSPFEALKMGFRRACVKKLVGDDQAAVAVLRDEIPRLVVSWAKTTNLSPSEKKIKLKELFDDESSRADELATAFDLFASRFEVRVANLVRDQVSVLVDEVKSLKQDLELQPSGQYDEPIESKVNTEALTVPVNKPDTSNDKTLLNGDLSPEEIRIPDLGVIDHGLIGPDDDITECEPSLTSDGLRFDEIEEMIDEILLSSH